jgi:hypothetical protein
MLRRFFITASLVLVCASATYGDEIAVYSDRGRTSRIWSDEPTLQEVHVFHLITEGATAAEWKLNPPESWVYLGEVCPIFCIGRALDGISISYEECLTGSIYLMPVHFVGKGLEDPCTWFGISGYHGEPAPLAVDCAGVSHYVTGGQGLVNDDGTCSPVPVETTSWGRIKALYE